MDYSSSLNKGNHGSVGVWISELYYHRSFRFYFTVFYLVVVSIVKIYQTLKRVLGHIAKHLDARQKYSAKPRIFLSLLGVWKCGQTRVFFVRCIIT